MKTTAAPPKNKLDCHNLAPRALAVLTTHRTTPRVPPQQHTLPYTMPPPSITIPATDGLTPPAPPPALSPAARGDLATALAAAFDPDFE